MAREDLDGVGISRQYSRISHLFADDTIIFGWAMEEAMVALKFMLREYGMEFG
ncbi:UNVERIFIED_CONTAM: hypothetical protein Sradi_0855100 [Sesamum radiatum]|uniref:Reverse transcriptase domain-containing protein n=1 Tax=Sesamum radiatum TaxID=300843 RepID=A0AAW2V200_SESRA